MRRKYFWKSAKGSHKSFLQMWRFNQEVDKEKPKCAADKRWYAELNKMAKDKPRRRFIGYMRCAAGSGNGAFHLWAGAYAGAEND